MSGDDIFPSGMGFLGISGAGGVSVLAATGANVLAVAAVGGALVVLGALLVRFAMHRGGRRGSDA